MCPEKGVESRTKCTVVSQKVLHIGITTNLFKLLGTNLWRSQPSLGEVSIIEIGANFTESYY